MSSYELRAALLTSWLANTYLWLCDDQAEPLAMRQEVQLRTTLWWYTGNETCVGHKTRSLWTYPLIVRFFTIGSDEPFDWRSDCPVGEWMISKLFLLFVIVVFFFLIFIFRVAILLPVCFQWGSLLCLSWSVAPFTSNHNFTVLQCLQ